MTSQQVSSVRGGSLTADQGKVGHLTAELCVPAKDGLGIAFGGMGMFAGQRLGPCSFAARDRLDYGAMLFLCGHKRFAIAVNPPMIWQKAEGAAKGRRVTRSISRSITALPLRRDNSTWNSVLSSEYDAKSTS